jgi:hypothetical protein
MGRTRANYSQTEESRHVAPLASGFQDYAKTRNRPA